MSPGFFTRAVTAKTPPEELTSCDSSNCCISLRISAFSVACSSDHSLDDSWVVEYENS